MFFIIIFLLLAVYMSYSGYQKKYLPITLSNFEYSTYKSHKNVPEGVDSLTASALIGQCPAGQCVVDIATGFKRCAENPTSKLTYNMNEEACTRLNFCDYVEIPYAVRSDGSAISNECEKSPDGKLVPCRCIDKKTCANHELSKFIIRGGDPSKVTENNFKIIQSTFTNQGQIGYSPIELENQSQEFCQINPGFTSILTHGCDFINSANDKLGCQTISNIVEGGAVGNLDWKISEDVTINQASVTLEAPVGSQNLFLPSSGMITLINKLPDNKGSDTKLATEVISYSGVGSLSTDNTNNIQTIKIYNINNISTTQEGSISDDGIPGKRGFQIAWNVGNDSPNLQLTTNSFIFCSSQSTDPNYKNMLLCTQRDNNVCKFGNFTYNFDKLTGVKDNTLLTTDETFTRNFCQLALTNNINLERSNYLEDPEFYTLSCALGSGCDGKNFQVNATEESNGKYFPEVDIDGINGIWNLEDVHSFPYLNLDNPGGGIQVNGKTLDKKILLNNENLQAGDFWSIKVINQNLISGSQTTPEGVSIIIVQDLFGLDNIVNAGNLPSDNRLLPGISIGTCSYQLINANYGVCTINGKTFNQSSIGISPFLREEVAAFSDIRINPPNIDSDQTYGIIIKDESGGTKTVPFSFRTLEGKAIPLFNSSVDISIYKQFAFSGPNYVTKVSDQGVSGNFRIYTRGDGDIYKQIIKTTSDKSITTPMVPPENIYQLQFSTNRGTCFNLNYYSPQAPFKIPMSMYYPVWNPVLYQQECIRCKPLLLTFAELDVSGNISNVVIQFSGKDFGSYEYNASPTAGNNKYCYVSTSEINFNNTEGVINTTQRIMLKEPNLTVNVGDYVLDSTLQMPYTIFSEGNLDKSESYYSFFIAPQIFPSKDAVKYFSENCLDKAGIDFNGYLNWPNPVTKNPFTINFGIDESTSENFVYKSDSGTKTLFPNQLGTIRWSNSSNSWNLTPESPGDNFATNPNNYFFGKKYQSLREYKNSMNSSQGEVYTSGFYFVPSQKVTAISADRKTIIVDSLFPKEILQRKSNNIGALQTTYVQFCRLDSPLKLDVTTSTGTVVKSEEVVINSISDSRITNIKITKSGSRFLQENLPGVKLNLKDQKFL